jgi:hypothetical protein
MDSATLGLIGGIAGACVGAMGGALGIYFSLKNTNGPKERAFVVRAVLGFVGFSAVCGVIWALLPGPYRGLAFVPFWIWFPFAIHRWNKRQMSIREMEAMSKKQTNKAERK